MSRPWLLLLLLGGCAGRSASLSGAVLQPPADASVQLRCPKLRVERELPLDAEGRFSAEGLDPGLCFLSVREESLGLEVGAQVLSLERAQHQEVTVSTLPPEMYTGARAANPDFVEGLLHGLLPLEWLPPLDPGEDGESYRLILRGSSACRGMTDHVYEFHRRGEEAWGVLAAATYGDEARREVALDPEAVQTLGGRLDALGLSALPPVVEDPSVFCFTCVPVLLEVARSGQPPWS